MKQMKRAMAAVLAAALLAGCAGQETGQSVSAPPASESAPQTDGAAVEQLLNGEHALTALPSGYMGIPLTQTGQGMYEFVNLEDRYLLCYVDYAAGTRAPLCDAAGCAHADESCPAYSPYYRNVGMAGDWLLTSGTNADGTCSLDARRLDGSEKRTLFTGAEGDSLYPWGFAMEGGTRCGWPAMARRCCWTRPPARRRRGRTSPRFLQMWEYWARGCCL